MNDNTTLHARLLTLQDEMEKKAGLLDFFVKNKSVANTIRNIAAGFGKATEAGTKGALGLGYWARKPLFWGGAIGGAYALGKGYKPGDIIDKGRGALIRGLGGQYDPKGGKGSDGAAAGGAAGGTSAADKAKDDAAAKAQAARDRQVNALMQLNKLSREEAEWQVDNLTDDNISTVGTYLARQNQLDRMRAKSNINGKQLGIIDNKANTAFNNSLYSDPGSSSGRPTGRPGY